MTGTSMRSSAMTLRMETKLTVTNKWVKTHIGFFHGGEKFRLGGEGGPGGWGPWGKDPQTSLLHLE